MHLYLSVVTSGEKGIVDISVIRGCGPSSSLELGYPLPVQEDDAPAPSHDGDILCLVTVEGH